MALTSITRVLLSQTLILLAQELPSQISPEQCSCQPRPLSDPDSPALVTISSTSGEMGPLQEVAVPFPCHCLSHQFCILIVSKTWTFLAAKLFYEEVKGVMIISQNILQATPALDDNCLTMSSFVLKTGVGIYSLFLSVMSI